MAWTSSAKPAATNSFATVVLADSGERGFCRRFGTGLHSLGFRGVLVIDGLTARWRA
jgi:hypothetical protein